VKPCRYAAICQRTAFSKQLATDIIAFIINEAAVEALASHRQKKRLEKNLIT